MLQYLNFTILLSWFFCFTKGEDTLYETVSKYPEELYFDKYPHCSTTTSRLQQAYDAEGDLVEKIFQAYDYVALDKTDKYDSKDYEELDLDIKKKMSSIMNAREKENSTSNIIDHPINAIHFLRRIVIQFNFLFDKIFSSKLFMKRNFYQDLSLSLDKYIRKHSCCWPSFDDLKLAITGLARISKTYKLSKADLIKGLIMTHQSIEPLDLDEIIVLVQEANRNNYYEDVLEWTELLLKDSRFNDEKNKKYLKNIIKLRAAALYQSNNIQQSIEYLENIIKENKFDTKSMERDLKFYQSKLKDHVDNTAENRTDYDGLCRISSFPSSKRNLHCFYGRNQNGWDRIKVEILNINPPILKYFEVANNDDFQKVFQLVKKTETNLHKYNQKGEVISDAQNAKEETIFWDEEENIMRQLSKKVSYFTGLETSNYKYNTKLSASGPFKIINYGIGGFEELQVDYLANDKNKSKKDISIFGGDRMATWIYYLTDKVLGGQVIFPKINISVPIEQGTGLLWFNLLRNGKRNPLTEHMECPTVMGSKWVIKKFIHENGNMFARKCLRKMRTLF